MSQLSGGHPTTARADSPCMFCLRDDGGFTSVEHIVPESLGNDDRILPKGYVCDRCNHGVLSNCDDALTRYPPVAFQKTMHRIRSKKGKLPKMDRGKTNVYALATPDDDIYLRGTSKTLAHDEESLTGDMPHVWSEELCSRAARSLLKSGLEFLALEEGKSEVLEPRYDGIRRAVLEGVSGIFFWLPGLAPTSETVVSSNTFHITGPERHGMAVLFRYRGIHVGAVWPAIEREVSSLEGLLPVAYTFTKYASRPSKRKFSAQLGFSFSFDSIVDGPSSGPVHEAIEAIESGRS